MRRIGQRIALTVISGIAGNKNAQRSAATIFCRKKSRIVLTEKMRYVEIVKDVLMDSTPPVSATACRRFFGIYISAARSEGKKVI